MPDEDESNSASLKSNDESSSLSLVAMAWLWGIRSLRLLLPVVVIWLVWHELKTLDLGHAQAILHTSDAKAIAAALAATVVALIVMGFYDLLAFRSTSSLGPFRRWRIGVLLFSWTNFLTLGPIAGPVLRLLLYRRGGMAPEAITTGLARLYVGIFSGLTGWILATLSPMGARGGAPALAVTVTMALLISVSLTIMVGKALRLKGPRAGDRTPWPTLAALGVVGALDWVGVLVVFWLCGMAVGVELPISSTARALFLGQGVGIISMIPGGLGSADAVWLKLLSDAGASTEHAAAQILLFRLVFYVVPWLGAMVIMYVLFAVRWRHAAKWQRRVLATAAFVNGFYLLLSAATPAVADRLRVVSERLPLGAIEASHAVSIIAATTLLYLARGLMRGYRAAFTLAVVSLLASVGAHLLKGGDFEEAAVSVTLLVFLLGARGAFPRRGRVPIGWELALSVGAASIAFFLIVGFIAFSNIPYHNDLWVTFSAKAEASRFLRGAVLLGSIALLMTLRQAVRPAVIRVTPSDDDIDRAVKLIQSRAVRSDHLMVAVGDKGVWWWRGALGVALHQRIGDRMIIFRDPVCAPQYMGDLLTDLHQQASDDDLNLVFYEVTPELMPHLHDFGHSFFKLGEEAIVPIDGFSFEGKTRAGFRRTIRRVEATGLRYRVIEPPIDGDTIDQLRVVSDAWLDHKHVRELQCSVGYFTPDYVRRFPVAVAETGDGELVAFVNLLCAAPETEVAVDLMRYRPDVVDNLMDYVLIQSMRWASEKGYKRFNLGMAPLYDVGQRSTAATVERVARLVFQFGERVYNYQGLHNYKNKFHPVWEPRYLTYPKPWDWPGAVLETTRLIRAASRSDRERISRARIGRESQ